MGRSIIRQVSGFRFILNVSRPRFWFYTFGPYLIGLVAGISDDHYSQLIFPAVLIFAAYFLFPANLLIYGVNDIFDYETDRQNPKKGEYELLVGPDKRRSVATWIVLANLPFALAALTVLKVEANISMILVAFVCFLFFSIFYSAPPIRAKTKPFLDSAFNILYVMPGVFGYALIAKEFPPLQPIIAAGCWTAAMHAYSAIPDIEADRVAGINTIATVCGTYGTLAFCFLLYLVAAILSIECLGLASITLGAAYLLLMIASIQSARSGRLFKLYRAFPLINVAAGFVLFWSIAFSKM